jgi:hypothetical protein
MAPMHNGRNQADCVVARHNQCLYAVGGFDENDAAIAAVECFDPTTSAWEVIAYFGTPRGHAGSCLVEGPGVAYLYVVCGSDGNSIFNTFEVNIKK